MVRKVTAQKGSKKSVKSMVFRVQLFWTIQGARSRGSGRNCTELAGAQEGVLEDTFLPLLNPDYMAFAATFPASG